MKILKLFCLGIALLLSISIGYSKLQQQLSVSGTANVIAENQDVYSSSYTLSKWQSGSLWHYQYTITITYLGNDNAVTSWDLTATVPGDATPISASECRCSYKSGVLKVYNISYGGSDGNGTVSPNGSVTFTIDFSTSVSNYDFQISDVNFYSTANPNPNLTEVDGTYTFTKGAGYTDSTDGKYIRSYSLVLTNPTPNIFQSLEAVVSNFDPNLMEFFNENISSYTDFHLTYIIKNNSLIIDGTNLGSNSSLYLNFQVKYLTSTIIDLSMSSFKGKTLILS